MLLRTQSPVRENAFEGSSGSPVYLVDGRVSSVGHPEADMISLLTILQDPRADVVSSITVAVDGPATVLTDYEVPYLKVLRVVADARDTHPAVNGPLIFNV
jgi:hypothetical protein